MAPSASMLFLSYHQLHGPAEAPPRREVAGGSRLGLSNVFLSLGVSARPREAAAAAAEVVGAEGKRGRDVREETAEMEGKFEEALRLSCWSS